MVNLGMANTRMKDFHDVWFLSRRFELDRTILRQAIEATFAYRRTRLPPSPEPFSNAFANDPTKQVQWTAFLRRNGLIGITDELREVVTSLRQFIEPVLRRTGSPPS